MTFSTKTPFVFLFLLIFAAVSAAEVTILQTTDLHGTMQMPAIARIIEKERAAGSDPLWIDCGDMIQGTPGAALDHGCGITAWANEFHCDVCVPGNHDFDFGTDVFRKHLQHCRADFLAANLTLDPAPEKPILPWKTYIRHGVRIAVIGCAPPYLDQWIARAQLKGVHADMPEDALAKVMPQVRAAKPDLIVLAIHLGEYTAGRLNADGKVRRIGQLVRRFPEISIVLGGHTHQTVEGKRILPDAWYVQAPPHGDGVVRITIRTDDATGKVTEISSSRLLIGKERANRVPPEWSELEKRLKLFAAQPVADLPEKFFPSKPKDGEMFPLFARAVREITGADAAFCSGSSDVSFTGGRMTERDLFRKMPYENPVTVLTLNAAQLHAVVRELCGDTPVMPHNGLDCALTGAQPKTEIRFRGKTVAPNDPSFRIRVAFTSFTVAGGGGRYPVLKKIAESPDVQRNDLRLTVRDTVREFLKKAYPLR